MQSVAKFVTKAYPVSGCFDYLSEVRTRGILSLGVLIMSLRLEPGVCPCACVCIPGVSVRCWAGRVLMSAPLSAGEEAEARQKGKQCGEGRNWEENSA